jgi:hypothetical protein
LPDRDEGDRIQASGSLVKDGERRSKASSGLTTLPIEIFSYLQFQGSQLVIAAASTLQIAMIVVMVAAIERIVGVGRIIRSR